MQNHLLTFELGKDGDTLDIHGDASGLRLLAKIATRLAEEVERGEREHTHLMTEEWGGKGLSSGKQDPEATLLNMVTIRSWTSSGGLRDL